MAEFLEEILGDLLFRDPVDGSLSTLPSPEQLKNKILVKVVLCGHGACKCVHVGQSY